MHTLVNFLHEWAASDHATSYSEQQPSGSFTRIAFRLNRDGDERTSLELIARSEYGKPVIELVVANLDPSTFNSARHKYPSWEIALDSIRRTCTGPMSRLLFEPESETFRGEFVRRFRDDTAGLPEPMPEAVKALLRDLEAQSQ